MEVAPDSYTGVLESPQAGAVDVLGASVEEEQIPIIKDAVGLKSHLPMVTTACPSKTIFPESYIAYKMS